ncbi:thioredoxin family protein [Maribacter spongiicola]|uniref:thioredoxin family protein n=1 Tax=Maribacter spongiicola TaxID=1206753 RepID=UPI003F9A7BB6
MKSTLFTFLIFAFTIYNVQAQDWETDFTAAKKEASKNNRPIILVFQGSDWCAPCIKLDREIWSTENFKTYAKDHYIMLQADFPRKNKNALSQTQTAANKQLAETYNKQGFFPFVVILDSKGEVLGQISYKKTTPENFIKELNNFIK